LKGLLTRREMLSCFSKDMLKNVVGAYTEFSESQREANKMSCDDAGIMLAKRTTKQQKLNKEFRKEG